ncbi:ChaC-like protein [Sphaerosporella brunnea]|uniref:glutathione-specific gamma-glutamylcyclotransferase n=1 Tax=Sphaerosporella brunnea TaxID=1250544 RepID=A0A5J5EDT1_9PEZI|nr:ChaC-like protein [Sphaerosporella brunnea]
MDIDSTPSTSEDLWIFGYGSLIWKPPPHFAYKQPGYIRGYVRRFWQASEDHRGTPEAPGRVVTLISHPHWQMLDDHHLADEKVWGTAYRIPAEKVAAVKEYLDIREINGYDPLPPIRALVYIGTPENPQFVPRNGGVPGESELAAHIFKSRGPSGENKDYLYQLHHALEGLCPESKDNHVRSLFRKVCILEAEARLNHFHDADDDDSDKVPQRSVTASEETRSEIGGGGGGVDIEMKN